MKSLARRLLMRLSQTKLYRFIMKRIIPFVRFTMYYPSFNGFEYAKAADTIEPGDIILCKDNKKLTSYLIGGKYSHAALCVSKFPNQVGVLEFTHLDGSRTTLFDVCRESDAICILRCKDIDYLYRIAFIAKAWELVDSAKYDLSFELGVEALYCSEFIYQADFEHRLQISLEDIAGLGVPYISPTGLYEATNCFIIYETKQN